MWIPPVFDRTSEDVLKVQSYETIEFKYLTEEQKAEWLSGLKGAWNYKDLSRIENDTEFLADIYGIKNMNYEATPYKGRLSPLRHICGYIFRNIAQKLFGIRKYSFKLFALSCKKFTSHLYHNLHALLPQD